MTADWVPGRVGLHYRLGEVTLYTWSQGGFVSARHFSELTAAAPPEAPCAQGAPPGDGPFVMYSRPVPEGLPQLALSRKWIRYVPYEYRRYYVDLSGDFDSYLKRFSSKSRSTLARKVRRFVESSGGTIDWREYRTPAELEIFFSAARALSARTYQERLLDSGLPGDEAFRQNMLEAAGRSEVRGYLLFLNGEAAAYVYCPLRSGVLGYQFVGFDPDHQQLSPGTVLQYLILQRLFGEGGYRMFDFTGGEGPQKAFFATHHARCADVYFYRRTARNLGAVRAHVATDRVSSRIGGMLDRLGLKTTIRRLLRRTA